MHAAVTSTRNFTCSSTGVALGSKISGSFTGETANGTKIKGECGLAGGLFFHQHARAFTWSAVGFSAPAWTAQATASTFPTYLGSHR